MPEFSSDRYLLPAGFKDGLPPDSAFEAEVVEQLMHHFATWSYQRVKPPLIEFEDSLLSGPGEAMRAHTFRLMDPVSQRMMGLRADMTPQVGRIAASRLGREPRPLRLSYAGQVLRVKGEQMRPERQIGQAGIELIGSAAAQADAEVVLLAAEALGALGISGLVIDLNIPTLAPSLLRQHGVADPKPLILALDRKDAAAIQSLSGDLWPQLEGLLKAIGGSRDAVGVLSGLKLTGNAALELNRLIDVVGLIHLAAPELALTIDPTDHRGFEYHSGVTFTFLGQGATGEFGRGGRYVNQAGEHATGFTLYLDTLLQALVPRPPLMRVYVPFGSEGGVASRLRREGWITVSGLDPKTNPTTEARRLGCQRAWLDGRMVSVDE